jgi:hypothetical protein
MTPRHQRDGEIPERGEEGQGEPTLNTGTNAELAFNSRILF